MMMDYLPEHLQENVSSTERGLSLLGSAVLAFEAFKAGRTRWLPAVFAGYLFYRGISGNCLLYSAMGKTKPDNHSRNINIRVRQIVNRPRPEVYSFWRDFENLPRFMAHLEEVHNLNDDISVWQAHLPGSVVKLHWKSEIVKERPGEFIGWHSLPGSSIESAGKVEFWDAGAGTEIQMVLSYHAPGGLIGESAGRLLNPLFERAVREDLEGFKNFLEGV